MTMATVSLKLLVDTQRNLVVFAEATNDFVDILFSFLTLPMGAISRLLGKNTSVGCMDKLYKSVENLSTKYFETGACRTMLLEPRCAAEQLCEGLLVKADNLDPRRFYLCSRSDCFKSNCLYSSVCGARCPCGKSMDICLHRQPKSNAKGDVFLKGEYVYVIRDDLHVVTASTAATLFLFQKMEIRDAATLDERIVEVNRNEVLNLLKASLLSKTPLTDVFLQRTESVDSKNEELEILETTKVKLESEDEVAQDKTISFKLLQDKTTKKLLYAEARNDMVDVLLCFLTYPLGSVVKLLNQHSLVGCIDNLYCSVEVLAGEGCIKSEACKNMLLDPKVYPHFNCSNQILKIETDQYKSCDVRSCSSCSNSEIFTSGGFCGAWKHSVVTYRLTEMNPKMPNSSEASGGGFVKGTCKFMVSDEMVITPLSPISTVNLIKELNVPICNLVEKEVTFGEPEFLDLLKATLVSSNPLSKVFSGKKPRMSL